MKGIRTTPCRTNPSREVQLFRMVASHQIDKQAFSVLYRQCRNVTILLEVRPIGDSIAEVHWIAANIQ